MMHSIFLWSIIAVQSYYVFVTRADIWMNVTVECGDIIRGSLPNGSEVIFYEFEIDYRSDEVLIDTCDSNFETDLYVYDSNGTEIDDNDDSSICGWQSRILLTEGIYYIAITGHSVNDYGLYKITIDCDIITTSTLPTTTDIDSVESVLIDDITIPTIISFGAVIFALCFMFSLVCTACYCYRKQIAIHVHCCARYWGFEDDDGNIHVIALPDPEDAPVRVQQDIEMTEREIKMTQRGRVVSAIAEKDKCKIKNLRSWMLTIMIWVMAISALLCSILRVFTPWFFVLFLLIAYLSNLAECAQCPIFKYLRNSLEGEDAIGFVQRLKNERADVIWSIECYHMESRTRVYTDTNGITSVQHYKERVVTWSGFQHFSYSKCVDVSGEFVSLDPSKSTKLTLSRGITFGNTNTSDRYDDEMRTFKTENNKDQEQYFTQHIVINGFREDVFAHAEAGVDKKWMTVQNFIICSLLVLSPCFRWEIDSECQESTFQILKQLS